MKTPWLLFNAHPLTASKTSSNTLWLIQRRSSYVFVSFVNDVGRCRAWFTGLIEPQKKQHSSIIHLSANHYIKASFYMHNYYILVSFKFTTIGGNIHNLRKLIYLRFTSYLRPKYIVNPVALRVVVRGMKCSYPKTAVLVEWSYVPCLPDLDRAILLPSILGFVWSVLICIFDSSDRKRTC